MKTSLEVALAAELRAELARQRRSKRSLATELGVPPSNMNRWLNAETSLNISELDAICRALHITIADLLNRLEPVPSEPTSAGGIVAGKRGESVTVLRRTTYRASPVWSELRAA